MPLVVYCFAKVLQLYILFIGLVRLKSHIFYHCQCPFLATAGLSIVYHPFQLLAIGNPLFAPHR